MRYIRVASLIFCVVSASTVNVKALPGTLLYRDCHEKTRSIGDAMCVAYIHGFLDGLVIGRVAGEQNPPVLCPPKDGIEVDQGRLIIEKYLRDHPERLHEEAGLLAAAAMLDAFPCRKSN